jgi:uncharacterized circularly permuted ATP-grasp superfamily protein/uncharacterized alpha-E superfamily protein
MQCATAFSRCPGGVRVRYASVTPMTATTPAERPKEGFSRLDEGAAADRAEAEAYGRLRDTLSADGPEVLARLGARGQRLMRELGVTFALYDDDDAAGDWIVPYDVFPRVIGPAQWARITQGVIQRVAVWNEFFRDIYDSQEALKAGVIPFELVYDDPAYQRNAAGLAVPGDTFVHLAAFDLARDPRGRWVVIEDYVGNVTGMTYALQARAVLGQAAPELLEAAPVAPVRTYPTELLEHLRRFARGTREPRVVLLSPGTYNSAHYEHAWLARQMGIPLVRGGDLIVLNSRCYLKTIGGLEPIDVIYRRLDDAYIDPVALRQDSTLGVPGLMTCVRKGTVTIANAIGTGLGDNRALATLLPRLSKFYGKGPLTLPGVERRLCFDPDQLELVEASPEDWVFQHVNERSNRLVWHPGTMDAAGREAFLRDLRRNADHYVAEPYLPLTTLPTASADLAPRHAGLRVFVFGGPEPRVFPLALTRHATEADSRTISSGLGGGIRDTWILRDDDAPAVGAVGGAEIFSAPQQRRLRLGSRIADGLYWMGRYKARAEQVTRTLDVIRRLGLETAGQEDAESWAPLWSALARATGHDAGYFHGGDPEDRSPVRHLLLDPDNAGSVASCTRSLRDNARGIRESIPPEVWSVIQRLHMLCVAAGQAGVEDDPARLQEFEQQFLDTVDMLTGTATKNMLHDDAWHFWKLGQNVERALTTTLITRQVLLRRDGDTPDGRPGDLHLDALLRMLSCQYAYRSLYQARPSAPNIVALVLQDAALPRSVLACLEEIRASLVFVGGHARHAPSPSPLRSVAKLSGDVEFADLQALFTARGPGRPPPLGSWLDDLAARLAALSTEISDHHLYHQAFNILR